MQNVHKAENTGKYMIIKCLSGCKFSAWYNYEGPDGGEYNLKYFRCIQHTHDFKPHMDYFNNLHQQRFQPV